MKSAEIYILALLFLIACRQSEKKAVSKNIKRDTIHMIAKIPVPPNDTPAIPTDTVPKIVIPAGTIQVSEGQIDTTSTIKILYVSDYNEQDGINPKDAKLDWKGLFYKGADFYLKSTKIKLTPEHSEMDDKESQQTGWRLTCDNKDDNIILIHGAGSIADGRVIKAFNFAKLPYAGQKFEFNYYGTTYTLYTTGYKKDGFVYNYKLFLMANVKGHYFNQLLISLPPDITFGGEGEMSELVEIEFAGDLDGDKIPDFIITGSGFPYANTYLYLSKPAGDKAILKLVSYFGSSD
jgi:hypothetical protein